MKQLVNLFLECARPLALQGGMQGGPRNSYAPRHARSAAPEGGRTPPAGQGIRSALCMPGALTGRLVGGSFVIVA
jgi:hypothetical protein